MPGSWFAESQEGGAMAGASCRCLIESAQFIVRYLVSTLAVSDSLTEKRCAKLQVRDRVQILGARGPVIHSPGMPSVSSLSKGIEWQLGEIATHGSWELLRHGTGTIL